MNEIQSQLGTGTDSPAGSVRFRSFEEGDIPDVWGLWTSCEGVGFGPGDTHSGTAGFLRRNPGLSLVATIGTRIVAAALCGQDGRRGFIYHLAVAADQRRRGLGAEIVRRCLEALAELGIERCQVVVYASNDAARSFWETVGGNLRSDLVVFSLPTPAKEGGG
jgi:ribosomal protein S18 acetylase RimI-like enzyme